MEAIEKAWEANLEGFFSCCVLGLHARRNGVAIDGRLVECAVDSLQTK